MTKPNQAQLAFNSKGGRSTNSIRNAKAKAQLTDCEWLTGKTAEQLRADMHEQKQRVLAKLKGMTA